MKVSALYQSVTDSIIRQLEQGTVPWVQPWKNGNGGGIMPFNSATRRSYNGINIMILWAAREAKGYPLPAWLTFKQSCDHGGRIRKGEKGTAIVFSKKLTVQNKDSEEEKRIGMLKTFYVFNIAQIDGLTFDPPEESDIITEAFHRSAFELALNADIRVGGDRACYVPSRDFIAMPPESAFRSREHFLATRYHELVHWSGAKHRLDRELSGRFGTQAYAAEELIAELGAAFLCAHLGVTGELRHADYIANWLTLLRSDDRAIFTASSQASQAANYLRSFSEQIEEAA